MTPEEARQLVGVERNASHLEVEAAFQSRFQEMESKLERAPTPSLKEKYRRGLTQLEEAWEALSTENGNQALDNFPSLHPVVVETPIPATPESEPETSESAAVPSANHSSGWLIGGIVFLICTSAAAGWYFGIEQPAEQEKLRQAEFARREAIQKEQELEARAAADAVREKHAQDIAAIRLSSDSDEAAECRLKATAGDVISARELGLIYYNGKGVMINFPEASKWLQMAADHGDAQAQFYIAWITQLERPERLSEQVFRWMQNAADQDFAPAQVMLASIYYLGEPKMGIQKDQAKASSLFATTLPDLQKAAEEGNPLAQTTLSKMYLEGWGVAVDPKQALEWCEKAANQGYPDAEVYLGGTIERGVYHLGAPSQEDQAKALKWFQKAADQGHPLAQITLADWYLFGVGESKDYQKALFWFQKAADQGFPQAQIFLGKMYQAGTGVSQDYQQALALYQKAANQGNSDAEYLIGNMYRDGLGVTADRDTAIAWYQKSAAQGNPVAITNLKNLGVSFPP